MKCELAIHGLLKKMNEIEKIFEKDVFKNLNINYKAKYLIKKYFHDLEENEKNNFPEKYLILWPFVNTFPFKYIDFNLFKIIFEFISKHENEFIKSIDLCKNNLTKAIFSFRHFNKELLNEDYISTLSIENIFNFDTVYHPEYLKIIEHVYDKLIDVFINIVYTG